MTRLIIVRNVTLHHLYVLTYEVIYDKIEYYNDYVVTLMSFS